MDSERLIELLKQVQRQEVTVADALARLRHLPFEDLGFAKIDHHRALRQGFPEVILGQGKEARDIAAIARAMRRRESNILITRLSEQKITQLRKFRTGLQFHSAARAATWV
jgi:NCAIR mutase (PurE)-related protein